MSHSAKQLTYTIILLFLSISVSFQACASDKKGLLDTIKHVEHKLNARIGVAIYEQGSSRNWQYHADDRFPIASTFKTLACATLLSRVDAGLENLNRKVTFEETDLVVYSPITQTRVGKSGMPLWELCEATMAMSDNSAANFILEAVGGPEAVTTFVQSIGDNTTRIDRWEPELNEATPGDIRDTTTPNAMAQTLKYLILGDTLTNQSRETLTNWLKGNKVSDALFRAGVPKSWVVADKTGAGAHGSRSIAAVMWPPKGEPIVATVYITETKASFKDRNAAISEIGKAIAWEIGTKENEIRLTN